MPETYEGAARSGGKARPPAAMRKDLPADVSLLVLPAAVVKAHRDADAAVRVFETARVQLVEARRVAAAAPAVDSAADADAARAGRPLPDPTAPVREAELQAAERAVAAHGTAAERAVDEFFGTLSAQQSRVIDDQTNAVVAEHASIDATLEQLVGRIERLHGMCGALMTVRMNDRRWGKRDGRGHSDAGEAIESLRGLAARLTEDATSAIDMNVPPMVGRPIGGVRYER